MKSESDIQQLIMIEAAKHRCILMRNNSGGFLDATGRLVYYGLGAVSREHNERIKSSDLIGIYMGLFVAIEVKKEGWKFNPKDKRENAQLAFINFIKTHGGIAGFASSVDDFLKLIGK